MYTHYVHTYKYVYLPLTHQFHQGGTGAYKGQGKGERESGGRIEGSAPIHARPTYGGAVSGHGDATLAAIGGAVAVHGGTGTARAGDTSIMLLLVELSVGSLVSVEGMLNERRSKAQVSSKTDRPAGPKPRLAARRRAANGPRTQPLGHSPVDLPGRRLLLVLVLLGHGVPGIRPSLSGSDGC